MSMSADRTLPWDWYSGTVPQNVQLADSAYVESTFSFYLFRSERDDAVSIGQGASAYLGTMFDVGASGRVTIGDYALINGARIVCDAEITIEDYVLVSWNVLLMDSYRVPADPDARRALVKGVPASVRRRFDAYGPALPIRIGRAAWLGFDCCVLPGVTVGEGAVVGARSIVIHDVEPYSIVAGNPARLVRRLTPEEINHGR
jgi:acetyltransferase-like isoleucine patch superfamily enzyme